MKKHPGIGEQVRVKNETGLHAVVEHGITSSLLFLLDDGRTVHLNKLVTRYQKYITLFVIQVHYDGGWEDVTQEETISEAIQRRKEYQDNQHYPVRLIRRREPNELYKGV